jgi:hypothetical protein
MRRVLQQIDLFGDSLSGGSITGQPDNKTMINDQLCYYVPELFQYLWLFDYLWSNIALFYASLCTTTTLLNMVTLAAGVQTMPVFASTILPYYGVHTKELFIPAQWAVLDSIISIGTIWYTDWFTVAQYGALGITSIYNLHPKKGDTVRRAALTGVTFLKSTHDATHFTVVRCTTLGSVPIRAMDQGWEHHFRRHHLPHSIVRCCLTVTISLSVYNRPQCFHKNKWGRPQSGRPNNVICCCCVLHSTINCCSIGDTQLHIFQHPPYQCEDTRRYIL